MSIRISELRHPKEKVYGLITLIFGLIAWFGIGALILSLILRGEYTPLFLIAFYVLFYAVIGYFGAALIRAYMMGHHVRVGPDQFPHIDKMVTDGANALGMTEAPVTFIYNSGGIINAFALVLTGPNKYVWIASSLVDTDDDKQLQFVIGHELGHHASGHLSFISWLMRLPSLVLILPHFALSRSREYTCDRIGFQLCGDIEKAKSSLQVLACGSAKLNPSMNTKAFALQDRDVPVIAGFFSKIFATHPRTTARVAALEQWKRS